ncbi:MAG: hypothetical protein H0U89_02145, partial [Acidimicrobiia bacterium]|nr:hypothetical protein [Acidimicrobiia bacterium]
PTVGVIAGSLLIVVAVGLVGRRRAGIAASPVVPTGDAERSVSPAELLGQHTDLLRESEEIGDVPALDQTSVDDS